MKLPPVQYLLVLAVSAGMFISGVSVLGYGLYKWKHHPTGPPHGIPTGRPHGGGTTTGGPSVAGTCDLKNKATVTIFLVDVADNSPSDLNEKLKNVRAFLLSFVPLLNLQEGWTKSKLGIAVYYGNIAYMLNNQLCSSNACWNQTINSLSESNINPYRITVHNFTRGIEFVHDEFSAIDGQLGYGVARKLVVIANGYEFTTWTQAPEISRRLHSKYFSVSVLLATQSIITENMFLACVDNSYNIYKLNGISEINNNAIVKMTVDWICRAYIVTTMGTTILPTKPHLPTTARTTPAPGQLSDRVEPCPQYIDLAIVFHATESKNFYTLLSFIGEELIGTLLGASRTQSNSPYNIAIMTYTNNLLTEIVDFTGYNNVSGYISLLNQTTFIEPHTTQLISNAYDRIGRMFRETGRYYASKEIVVITDFVDPFNAEAAKRKFDELPNCYVLGVELELKNRTLTVPHHELLQIDKYSSIDRSNQLSRREYGNQIASKLCRYVTPKTTTPVPTTTTGLRTPPPPAVTAREVWPDIAVLIDVSSKMGSRELETVDTFEKLQWALGEMLQFGEMPVSPVRDLNKALLTLISTVYVETLSDFNVYKENFLWIFLSGSPLNNDYLTPLRNLQKMGIRTEAIGLGVEVDNWHLSQFGYTSFQVSNWTDDMIGITATGDDLSDQIYDDTTSKRTQPLSKIYADFYFVIDQSDGVSASDFAHIKEFLISFTGRLSIDTLHCGIAIIPFESEIVGGQQLTYDITELNSYLNSLTYTSSAHAKSNIGRSVQMFKDSFWKNGNRSSHIIFILGSQQTVGAEIVAPVLQNTGNIYAISINPNVGYLNVITDSASTFVLDSSVSLQNWVEDVRAKTVQNPMTHFFMKLADVQETYMQSHVIPLKELNVDLVFAIDLTLIKKFILNFGKQFNIGPTNTQIAAHCYTDENNVENGFHFWEVKSEADFERKINGLKLETNDVPLPSDIAGAFIDIADYILTAENGWRKGPTYVIALSTAQEYNISKLINDPSRTEEARRKIFFKAQSLGLNMDGLDNTNAGFLRLFTTAFYAVVPNVEMYKTYNFPAPPPVKSVVADFVFIIDHSSNMTAQLFDHAKTLMIDLMHAGTFLPQNSRLGVIPYDSFGIVEEQIIPINKHLKENETMKNSIEADIRNMLDYRADFFPSNITSAIDYLVNRGNVFGLRTNVPVFVTIFAASPQISDYIPQSLISAFNARRLLYAFERNNLPYIDQLFGSQKDTSVSVSTDFILEDTYRQFITTGYQRWMTTFATVTE
ncbi:unnamed protein product [Enterobius vermicularis]|uniref:VWFA domain-containing protein n=1 Tax=Enterobius vermicularis TaxID=51028 RepID=A0A158Q9F7_ENTVE|nr:unnamed protein product [Enterobius vermicularis]